MDQTVAAVDWLPASEYPFDRPFIEVEGNRIHYVDEGAGAALLLVNVGGWSFIFRDLILRLRGSFRCGGNHCTLADDPDLVANEVIRWWREAVAPQGACSDGRYA